MNFLDATEAITVSEIARRVYVVKAWVSRTLLHLEQSGLLSRVNNHLDSRMIIVNLSTRGRNLLEQVRALASARETRLLDGIDKADLKANLNRLLANAERMLAS